MSIDLSKLNNVRQCRDKTVARCPACAEEDRDHRGEHLVIYPDGRFGCIVCSGPEGHEHRRRILALAGDPAALRKEACRIRVRRPAYQIKPRPPGREVPLAQIGRVAPDLPQPNAAQNAGCAGDSLAEIAGGGAIPDGSDGSFHPTRYGKVENITCVGFAGDTETHTRGIALDPSEPSGGVPLTERDPAMPENERQNTPPRHTNPETGHPIIDGAICPF